MDKKEKIKVLDRVLEETLKLISIYHKSKLPIPKELKGNIGEFLVTKKLLNKFQDAKIEYFGGAHPIFDIEVENIKIQVKTRFNPEYEKTKNSKYLVEGCPTVNRKTIEEKKVDFIIVLYLDTNLTEISQKKFYIFEQSDFQHFSTIFCFSGKSKGDYTIINVIDIVGEPPPKRKEALDFYNTDEYREVFKEALDGWGKIKLSQ